MTMRTGHKERQKLTRSKPNISGLSTPDLAIAYSPIRKTMNGCHGIRYIPMYIALCLNSRSQARQHFQDVIPLHRLCRTCGLGKRPRGSVQRHEDLFLHIMTPGQGTSPAFSKVHTHKRPRPRSIYSPLILICVTWNLVHTEVRNGGGIS